MSDILLQNLDLEFPIYGANTRSLKNQLVRFSTGGLIKNQENKIVTVKALSNISFRIDHGDQVGLIGHNGAGKSTLLRVLAGIYQHSAGHRRVDGKVTALLDVMLGLDPESTGHENIVMRGILHGLTRKQISKKHDDIAEFTELGSYLDMPIRTYSSGMMVRLAFGIATSIDPEILLLDEVVGAGDAGFQQRARERIERIIETSHIMVLSSHDLGLVERSCNKLIWLDAGQVKYFGEIEAGLQQYRNACGIATNVETETEATAEAEVA